MSDFTFVLGENILGSPYIMQGVQALVGQKVKPVGFAFRKLSNEKNLLVTVMGADGRKDYLPLHCFSQHPPEAEIREKNNLSGII
ncbi:hypothetical protein K8R61_01420 [bacterium]|nr:hypothetical protein [bacterium]